MLEKKPEIEQITKGSKTTRKIIEEEFDLVGYTSFKLNKPNGKIKYGSYVLDLYEGPIFVQELDNYKRLDS